MGWPGPKRRAVPLRLSDEEERPVRELANAEHNGNLSAAIRRIIAEWAAGRRVSLDRTDLRATADTPEEST